MDLDNAPPPPIGDVEITTAEAEHRLMTIGSKTYVVKVVEPPPMSRKFLKEKNDPPPRVDVPTAEKVLVVVDHQCRAGSDTVTYVSKGK